MNGFGMFHCGDVGAFCFPVGGDAEDGCRCGQGFADRLEASCEAVVVDGVHGVAVSEKEDGHAFGRSEVVCEVVQDI